MVLLNLPDHIIDFLLTIDHEELRQYLENIIRYGLGKYQHLIAPEELFAAIRHSIILLAEGVEGLHRGELLRQEYALDVYERYHRLEEDSNR